MTRSHSIPVLLSLLFCPLWSIAQFGVGTAIYPFGGTVDLEAADMDADGDLDLFGVFNGQHLKWFENLDGNGTFGPAQAILSISGNCTHFALSDVDQDSDLDILLIQDGSTAVELIRNLGSGVFDNSIIVAQAPSPPARIASQDLNGDGNNDLIVTLGSVNGGGFGWFPGTVNGYGTMVDLTGIHLGEASTFLGVLDIDLIGGLDIVLRADYDVLTLVRNVSGNASAWEVVELPIEGGQPAYPYRFPQLIDVDGDGDMDLAESRGQALHWLRNDLEEGGGFTFVERLVEPWTTGGNGAFGRSFCGPGASVVYVPANPAIPVRWSIFVPLIGELIHSNDLPGIPRASKVLLADLNGDGKDDLIMAMSGGVSWFPNVIAPSTTELELPELGTFCSGGPAIVLPEANPPGGSWFGEQIIGNELLRINIGPRDAYPIAHAVYEDQGCPLAAATEIRLIARPVITSSLPALVCSADAPIQLTSDPANTTWYGIGGGNILNPATFTGGFVVCEYADGTGVTCAQLQGPIQRWNSLPAVITPAGPFCETDPVQTITAAAIPPLGGNWSGDIIGSTAHQASFDPSIGAGEYEVILEVLPLGPNQCANRDTIRIIVGAHPVVSFDPLGTYCVNGGPITLIGGSPSGGFWDGVGVSEGVLDPTVPGPGLHLLTYFVNSTIGCGTQAATTIELADEAMITWTEPDLDLCPLDAPLQLTASPTGGIWSGPVDPLGAFDPFVTGAGVHAVTYTFTDPQGCELVNAPLAITVGTATFVAIEPVGLLCTTSPAFQLSGSSPGTWSGAVNGEGSGVTFDPAALGAGTWTVTLTAANGDDCPGAASIDIVVDVCAGLNETANKELHLSPNPFNSWTRLSLLGNGSALIDVLDATGRVVRSTNVVVNGSTSVDLDLSGQASGSYLVRTTLNGKVSQLRAVKVN